MSIQRRIKYTCLAAALTAATALTSVATAQDLAPSVQEIDGIYYVTWFEANVREGPSTGSYIIDVFRLGDPVTVTGIVEGTEWLRVELYDGQIGYMWAGNLTSGQLVGPGGGQSGGGSGAGPDNGAGGADGAGNTIYDAHDLGVLDSIADLVLEDGVSGNDIDDYYTFEVTDWTFVDLALENLSGDIDLLLLDEYEQIMGASEVAGASPEYVQQIIPAGRYYIHIYSFESATSDYTLYLYSEPTDPPPPDTVGNTMETAEPLDLSTGSAVFYERLDVTDYEDWFSITVEDFTEVTAILSGLQSDMDLEIVDDNGDMLQISDNGGNTEEVVTVVVGPGTYYVHAFVYSGQSDYTLEVSTASSEPPPADGAGNNMDAANDLGMIGADGLEAGDWLGLADSDDYYAFTSGGAGNIVVEVTGLSNDLDVELLDANGAIVAMSNNNGVADEVIATAVGEGQYYIHVYAFDGESDYSVSVSMESDGASMPAPDPETPTEPAPGDSEAPADSGRLDLMLPAEEAPTEDAPAQ